MSIDPITPFTLEYLATVAGASTAVWLFTNAIVQARPDTPAKVVAAILSVVITVVATVVVSWPPTVGAVFLALANSVLVYVAATGGATMLAARAASPMRARADKPLPFNRPWW